MLISLILELHYRCNIQVMLFMHLSEFDIFKMASRMVAESLQTPESSNLPVGMSD